MGEGIDFAKLYKTDVTKHITKKGQFNYLSWPYAVAEFRKACPNGSWRIQEYGENKQPYCVSDAGCFVVVTVYPDKNDFGFTQVHPVLNYKNKTVTEPNAFEINTSIQRCLVKAIALATGIGLHIYAGEDLPEEPKKKHDMGSDVPHFDDPKTKKENDADIRGWNNLCDEAAKKDIDTFRDWFKANKEDIKTDCGKDGMAEVFKHWAKVGKTMAAKNETP